MGSDPEAISQARERQKQQRRAICEVIFDRVANGESMASICRSDDTPNQSTILVWAGQDPHIQHMYTQALQMRAARMAEELRDHCTELETGENISSERVQALKVVINTKQWIMSRLLPKMYGDKTTVEHTGEVKTDEKQLDERIKALMSRVR